MKISNLIFSLLILCKSGISQDPLPKNISMWLKASIPIECRPAYREIKQKLQEDLNTGKITPEQYQKSIERIENYPGKPKGTGVLVQYNGGVFMITAKHMLEDSTNQYDNTTKTYKAYDNIAIMENETIRENEFPHLIRMLNVGRFPQYIYSKKSDLAIVSFKLQNPTFNKMIRSMGYEPINVKDIEQKNNFVQNQILWAIGYPGDLNSFITSDLNYSYFKSNIIARPIISIGKINFSNLLTSNYFTADLPILPGNSGGAVISDEKLIGIVSGVNVFETLSESNFKYGKVLPVFVKSDEIVELIKTLDNLSKQD